jgi:hypothetical protein
LALHLLASDGYFPWGLWGLLARVARVKGFSRQNSIFAMKVDYSAR